MADNEEKDQGGRPRVHDDTTTVSVSMDKSLRDLVDEIADQDFEGNRSKAVCAAIEEVYG